MPYDEGVAERIRQALSRRDDVVEKKMFGGIAFMVSGHMAAGTATKDLMLRVGPDAYEEALAQPHAREMDFTKRPLRGFVYVAPEGFAEDADLERWLQKAIDFVETLPPK